MSRRPAARHRPERHPQGVRRTRELHLPAAPVDAADDRPLRLLRTSGSRAGTRSRSPATTSARPARPPRRSSRSRSRTGSPTARRRSRRASPDEFGARLSFFFNAHNHFFQEVAKFRAARRLWAAIMRDRFGATNPRAQALRFHAQTGGSTLTAQQPENNVVRVAVQALSAVAGAPSRCTRTRYDEALALPTERSARIALRTQQILAAEAGRPTPPTRSAARTSSRRSRTSSRARPRADRARGRAGRRRGRDRARLGAGPDRRRRLPAYGRGRGGHARDRRRQPLPGRRERRSSCTASIPRPSAASASARRASELNATRARGASALAEVRAVAEGDGNMLVPMREALRASARSGRSAARSGASGARTTRSIFDARRRTIMVMRRRVAIALVSPPPSRLRQRLSSSREATRRARRYRATRARSLPLIADKCAGCHRLGGIAPFRLDTTAAAHKYARPDRGCSEESRDAAVAAWPRVAAVRGAERPCAQHGAARHAARAGARGGPTDGPATPAPPETTPSPARARRPSICRSRRPTRRGRRRERPTTTAASSSTRADQDAFVTSARIVPGAARVVHHVILFRVEPAQVAQAQRLDQAAAGQGWPCFGGTGIASRGADELGDAPWISAWAPGWGGGRLPEGTGGPLRGSRIVMQVHYNLLNGRTPDSSRAVLTVAPASTALWPLADDPAACPGRAGLREGARRGGCATATRRFATWRGSTARPRGTRRSGCSSSAAATPYTSGRARRRPASAGSTGKRRSTSRPDTCTSSARRSGSS